MCGCVRMDPVVTGFVSERIAPLVQRSPDDHCPFAPQKPKVSVTIVKPNYNYPKRMKCIF